MILTLPADSGGFSSLLMQHIMSEMQKNNQRHTGGIRTWLSTTASVFPPPTTTLSTWTLPSHWSSWGNALGTDNMPVARLLLQNILGTPWILCSGWTVTQCLSSSGCCQQSSHSCSQHDTAPQQFPHNTGRATPWDINRAGMGKAGHERLFAFTLTHLMPRLTPWCHQHLDNLQACILCICVFLTTLCLRNERILQIKERTALGSGNKHTGSAKPLF